MRVYSIEIINIHRKIIQMKFEEASEFQRELKKLKKKYKSLDEDFKLFKKILTKSPRGIGRHITELASDEEMIVIKSRLFCKYLKGDTLRIVYFYLKEEEHIVFIEIFYKGVKEREDSKRIKEYIKLIDKK
jgi:hypothetical protein